MKLKITATILFFFVCFCAEASHESTVKTLFTTALTERNAEIREQQYRYAFSIVRSYEQDHYELHNPYIIESVKKEGPSYLSEFSKNIFYAGKYNNSAWKNVGLNEGVTVLEGLRHFAFNSEDIVVKYTGRYAWNDASFLKTVKNNVHKYNAIVKCTQQDSDYGYKKGSVLLVAMAMKACYLEEMYDSFDYGAMEGDTPENAVPIEHAVTDYINNKEKEGSLKLLYVNRLGIKVNTQGSTTRNTIGGTAGTQTEDWQEEY